MKGFITWIFWPKTKISRISEIEHLALIFSNILPIFGVLFFNWEAFPILLLYCIEIVIGIIFYLLKSENPPKYPLFLAITTAIIYYFILLCSLFIILYFAFDEAQAMQSIRSIYFIVSAVIFIGNQLVFRIKRYLRTKRKKYNPRQLKTTGAEGLKPILLIVIALVIAVTGAFKIALITLVAIKTFLEIRSYLRRKSVITISGSS